MRKNRQTKMNDFIQVYSKRIFTIACNKEYIYRPKSVTETVAAKITSALTLALTISNVVFCPPASLINAYEYLMHCTREMAYLA
jgi:hypothetical protein